MSGVVTIAGTTWRVSEGGSVTRRTGRTWAPVTRAELLSHPVDGEVWEWLRGQGVRRPSPSGTRVPDTRTERGSRSVRLSDETIERADELAARWGCSRPEAIARALGDAARR